MKLHQFCLVSSILSVTASVATAGSDKYRDMDYGRFLSGTFNNTEGKNSLQGTGCATEKGIAIKLGGDKEGSMLFDTDLLRMSGGWTGGFVKLNGVTFDGSHGPNPQPADGSQLIFQTNRTPGWSKGDSFADPRKVPTGPGAATIAFGPLPQEWAKYKGLYLSGDNTMLVYSVGTATVMELPAIEKSGDQTFLTRTFNVSGKGAQGANLLAAEANEDTKPELAENGAVAILSNDPKNADARVLISVVNAPAGAKWEVADGKVVLKLAAFVGGESFKIVYSKAPAADAAAFVKTVKAMVTPANLTPLTKGGAAHWPHTVQTQGTLGQCDKNSAYAVDTIAPPFENPYKAWIRFAGLDFFKDGRAALSTWSGDVWIASGLDDKLEAVTWKRYATGLFQALGLKIVNDTVYVLGRDQITRLTDLNGDGEADFYENFNNDVQVTPGFHEFAFDLQTDPAGNFYFAKGGPVNPGGKGWGPLSDHNGCIFKVSKDGRKFEVFATGVRAPNGMGVGPNGEVTIGDNQGTWVPADYIHEVKQGECIEVPDLAHKVPVPTEHPKHLCWIPMDVDNSCGGHVWNTSDKWGPLKGQLIYLSYGKATLLEVLQERIGAQSQGAVVKFPLKFESGIMRARFSPKDGQLYVAGLKGWQTSGAKDAAFQRVRYSGAEVCMQNSLHITDKGIHIGFTTPLDEQSAVDAQNYSLQVYNYQWTQQYGSPDFKVSDPSVKGHDTLTVNSVTLSADKKCVFIAVSDLKPVDQFRLKMNIKTASGDPVPPEVSGTINVVPPDAKPGITYTSNR